MAEQHTISIAYFNQALIVPNGQLISARNISLKLLLDLVRPGCFEAVPVDFNRALYVQLEIDTQTEIATRLASRLLHFNQTQVGSGLVRNHRQAC